MYRKTPLIIKESKENASYADIPKADVPNLKLEDFINTDLIRKNIGNTLSAAYDATHGFSDQYLIEHNAFLECIKKAELNYSKDDMILFPNNKIPTISINYIK